MAKSREQSARAAALASEQRPDLHDRFESVPFPRSFEQEFPHMEDTLRQANASLRYSVSVGEGKYSIDDPMDTNGDTSAPWAIDQTQSVDESTDNDDLP